MPSSRPTTLFPYLALGIVGLSAVRAQITSNATCLSNWQDLYNSKGQSPCLVGAYLGGACNGGQYDVGALENGQHYIGPTSFVANGCLCSSVMYSMMGACSVCQNATIITWSSWSTNCPTVYVQTFPDSIPQDTAVPGWAYEAIPANGTFDVYQALQDSSPESTATFVQSTNAGTSSTRHPSSTSSSGSSSSSGSNNNSSSGRSSNTGAIAGGVVGGVVGLALIALLGFFLYRRNQKKKNMVANGTGVQANLTGGSYPYNAGMGQKDDYTYTPVPFTAGGYDSTTGMGVPHPVPSPNSASASGVAGVGAGGIGVGMMTSPPMVQQKLYDPNDPSTFPTSPPPVSIPDQSTGGLSHSGSGGGSVGYVPSFPQPQPHVQGSNQGMYRGVAEV